MKTLYIIGTLIALFIVRFTSNTQMNFQVLAAIIFGALGIMILIRSGNKAISGSATDKDDDENIEEDRPLVPTPTTFSENATPPKGKKSKNKNMQLQSV